MNKILTAIFVISLIIPCCFAASTMMRVTVEGDASVIMNSDRFWESGDDVSKVNGKDQYTNGASGAVLLTAPGRVQYQTSDKLDANVNNRYNRTDYYRFDNGGVFSNSVSMTDNTPNMTPIKCTAGNLGVGAASSSSGTPSHQRVDAQYTGILKSAEVDSASFVNDANVSLSQRAAFDGAGMYTGDTFFVSEIGGDNTSTTMKYRTEGNDHLVVSTNQTGGAIVRPEFSYIDFQDAFVTNQTGSPVNGSYVNQT